ncbi:MAG TPA: hypothetical protein PKD64_13300 [Pirellulaceae bacterium]|nr:hypothetical protein [Pirellulaceae bacterium]HMO93163.1 hypothetical protein [Pirellulaceae bacterium]HMP70008.1 hypothetical protein [Pirellulaceae bacterium]
MNQYHTFLRQLFEEGAIELIAPHEPSPKEIDEGIGFAESFEQGYRQELAGTPPIFSPEPFSWAALNFYRAAQFILYRDINAEIINAELTRSEKPYVNHSAIYSVDLVFRFLPDLLSFARREGNDDPVEKRIVEWLKDWPLSNAGTPTESFSDHPTLCRMYADRLIAKLGDRLELADITDDNVRQTILADLGLYGSQLIDWNQQKT